MLNVIACCTPSARIDFMSLGWRIVLCTLLANLAQHLPTLQAAESAKMNIVLIVADDLGWTDLGCYGSDLYETPHLDQLARDGMRFTQAYSACTVCSPTRAALMTGKYPGRLHITDWIPGQMPMNPKLLVPDWTKYLPLGEVTIAELFRDAGYATASIGKWHLGGEDYYPEKHGFDKNIAGTHAPQPPSYFTPYKIATLSEGPTGEYLTDRLATDGAQFIAANRDRPFFLYMPHFAVHLPQQAKEELIKKYKDKVRPGHKHTNPAYAAMIESLDDAVGRVRQELEKFKLADRTIVIFTSDNGGRIPNTSNTPLRFGKASCYEGGTRVPLIIYWPGLTKPDSECDTPVITMDLFPSLIEMTGVKEPSQLAVDGVSLTPLLRDSGEIERDELFWHYPHHQHYQKGGTTPYGAIRKGDFKLIEFFNDMGVELYNLRDDIGEQNDLARQMPEKANELRQRLHQWREDVGAQMPTRNPKHDPSKPEHQPGTDFKGRPVQKVQAAGK
jgi:arylsulfatase A-like enzyme